jgi:hypothetical protein
MCSGQYTMRWPSGWVPWWRLTTVNADAGHALESAPHREHLRRASGALSVSGKTSDRTYSVERVEFHRWRYAS